MLGLSLVVSGSGLISAVRGLSSSGIPYDWASLNASVDGRLHAAAPIALPCFSTFENQPVTPDMDTCSGVQANYAAPAYRVQRYSAAMNASHGAVCPWRWLNIQQTEWETCLRTHDQCLLDSADPSNPSATQNVSCGLGNVSPYYVIIAFPPKKPICLTWLPDRRTGSTGCSARIRLFEEDRCPFVYQEHWPRLLGSISSCGISCTVGKYLISM